MSSYVIIGFDEENLKVFKRQMVIAFLEDQRWRTWKAPDNEKAFVESILYDIDNNLDMDSEFENNHGSGLSSAFDDYIDWFLYEYHDYPERRSKMDEKLELVCKRLKCDSKPVMNAWKLIRMEFDLFLKNDQSKETYGFRMFLDNPTIRNLRENMSEAFENGVSCKYVCFVCHTNDDSPYTMVENMNHPDYNDDAHKSAWEW